MPNLEEFKLSMLNYSDNSDNDPSDVQVPKTLQKFHLEFKHERHLTFEVLKRKFLDIFKNQIRSLILIVNNASEECFNFDKLHGLINNFTRLETFQYYIRSNFRPDSRFPNIEQLPDSSYSIFTLPRLHPLGIISRPPEGRRLTLNQTITLEQLLNCSSLIVFTADLSKMIPTKYELNDNCKLVNLNALQLSFMNNIGVSDGYRFLSKVITLSPNLKNLSVYSSNTNQIIQHLEKLLPINHSNKMTYFCIDEHRPHYHEDHFPPRPPIYHATFFHELSQILPNLHTLSFICHRRFTDEYLTLVTAFIKDLQSYFSRL
jgi:hypothetical protein